MKLNVMFWLSISQAILSSCEASDRAVFPFPLSSKQNNQKTTEIATNDDDSPNQKPYAI